MSNKPHLIARKPQTSRASKYIPQQCHSNVFFQYETKDCFSRGGVRDPIMDTVYCGIGKPYQYVCLEPDRVECSIGNSKANRDPLLYVSWDERPPNLKCLYNIESIDNADQVIQYQNKFTGKNVDHLMNVFCNKPVYEHCAKGLEGGCSRYLALDDEGKVCRDWLASLPREKQDAAMRDYCLTNNTADCKCINRLNDVDYNHAKELGNWFNDNCWYKPCSNSETIYLVPNELASRPCATDICQQIIDVHAGGSVDISDNTNIINCNFGKNDILPKDLPEEPPETKYTRYNYRYWITCVTIVAICLLLATILYKFAT